MKLGFQNVTYSVCEGEGFLEIEVEPKNDVEIAALAYVEFTLTDSSREAQSEFSYCFQSV